MAGPDYKHNDPKGCCGDPRRGAALGRRSFHLSVDMHGDFSGKLYLREVRLDSGGYDPNGTYFGSGSPLYWCADADQEIDFMLRARSREDAKAQVRETYPKARFFR